MLFNNNFCRYIKLSLQRSISAFYHKTISKNSLKNLRQDEIRPAAGFCVIPFRRDLKISALRDLRRRL